MIFKFLRRKPTAAPAPAPPAAAKRPSQRPPPTVLERPAVPEAEELDEESAWDQWEHSQMELDSRMGPPSAFDSVRVKDPSPSQPGELDPFASVRRRRKP